MKHSSSKRRLFILICAGLLLWVIGGALMMLSLYEPSSVLVTRTEDYELRTYPEHIVAQTTIVAPFDEAVRRGTALLLQYLRGDNTIQESVAMARPEGVAAGDAHDAIAYWSPILVQKKGDAYIISAPLPPSYTIVTTPRPNNPFVRIIQVPETSRAVIAWHGAFHEAEGLREGARLIELLARDKRVTLSSASVTLYGASWVPASMRRIEVSIATR